MQFLLGLPQNYQELLLREKCPYSELICPAFLGIRTEYGEILRILLFSVWMQESMDQISSEYGHLIHSVNSISWFRF